MNFCSSVQYICRVSALPRAYDPAMEYAYHPGLWSILKNSSQHITGRLHISFLCFILLTTDMSPADAHDKWGYRPCTLHILPRCFFITYKVHCPYTCSQLVRTYLFALFSKHISKSSVNWFWLYFCSNWKFKHSICCICMANLMYPLYVCNIWANSSHCALHTHHVGYMDRALKWNFINH